MRTQRWILTLGAAGALALGAAACGSDNSSGTTSSAAKPKPAAQINALSGRTTSVKLDPGFTSALTSLKLTPAPIGGAKITSTGSAVFPITGGNVTYYKPGSVSPYVQGEIDHIGSGLSLTGGGKTVKLSNFIVDPGRSVLTGRVTVDGKVAADNAPLFFLDGRTLKPLEARSNGTAVLQGTTVKLKAEAADLLNKTFGVTALKPGFVVGVATITVNAK